MIFAITRKSKSYLDYHELSTTTVNTAGLNVDLDPFFELAELMMEMSQGTYGLLKTNN